jgi:hypothetical protein
MDIREVREAMRPIAQHVAAPVARPVTRTDETVAELRKRVESLAKRDRDATRRVRVHITCVSSGMIITVATTFTALPPIFHLAGCLAGIPAIAQEVMDWIRRW